MNERATKEQCESEAGIRAALTFANYQGLWKRVAELTTELNQHNKTCPVCNEQVSAGFVRALFGDGVKVCPPR